MNKRGLIISAAASIFISTFAMTTATQASSWPDTSVKKGCISANLPVAPEKGKPRSWKVAVTYCQPAKWGQGTHQVDVLTPGATYNRSYWDWPQQPELYSYVNKTLSAGRAALYYDRIGTGQSTRPASTSVPIESEAYVLNQLISLMKLAGYKKVNSIGHSYGSGIAINEAALYNGASKVVLTGYLHVAGNPVVSAGIHPASQDPKFAGLGLDTGYFTTRPGTRGTSFHAPTSNPAVIEYDEHTKDVVIGTGFFAFIAQGKVPAATNIANKVKVPVFVIAGERDTIYCYDSAILNCSNANAVHAHEAPYYANAASFKAAVVPGSGHDVALHPSANDSFNVINNWLK